MTPDATVVVRYDEADRTAVEQTLRKLVRTQGTLMLVLGTLLGAMVLVPFIAAARDGVDAAFFLVVGALLVVPLVLIVLGVRQLRRRPRLPEVAVTITPTSVLFPAIERPSALAPRLRAEEWPREGTSVEIVRASGLQKARVEFTRHDGGKRRRRSIAADSLDVDARVIEVALRGSHTS